MKKVSNSEGRLEKYIQTEARREKKIKNIKRI